MDNKNSTNPSMIYCICSGKYEDWDIHYTFTNKLKRDNLLKLLNQGEYNGRFVTDFSVKEHYDKYDLELDDNFDFSLVKPINYIRCKYSQDINGESKLDFDVVNTNSISCEKNLMPKEGTTFTHYFQYVVVYILHFLTEEELTKSKEELEEIYLNKCKDLYKEGMKQTKNDIILEEYKL